MKHKYFYKLSFTLIFIFTSSILFSGCWDRMDIDRRVYVATIGVDVGKDTGNEKELKEVNRDDPFQERKLERINVTYGFPDMSELGPQKSGKAKEILITTDAYSMEDAVYKATAKSSRSIDVGQTKLLIISSEILGYSNIVKEIIDYVQRQPRLNRNMLVVVAEGKTEEYMKYQPSMEKSSQAYITGLMENNTENASILPVTLDEFLKLLSQNGNAIIPRVAIDEEKKELSLSGVAIIKDYELKGFLNPVETSDLEILRGKIKGGKKVIFLDKHPIDYKIEGIKRKIKMDREKDKLLFNIDIAMEGKVRDYTVDEEMLSTTKLDKIEEYFNKSLSEECEQVVKLTQKEFKVDPIGLREYVEKYHPSVWKEVKGNWSQTYSNAEVKVNIATRIRRVGVVK